MKGAGPFDIPGDFYLDVPNPGTGARASTTDKASLDISSDIDIRVDATMPSWSPSSNRFLVSKYVTAGNQRSYMLGLLVGGRPFVQWSTDGAALNQTISEKAVPANSKRLTLRVTIDVDDGAGNRVLTFMTGPSTSGPWTTLSTITQAGTTSFFNSTSPLEIGNALNGGSSSLGGRVHKVEVRDGIGGPLRANPDFTVLAAGTTSFSDTATTVNTWTVSSPASITGFDWSTIPDHHVRSLRWTVGRDNELDQFRSGSATVELRNNDRTYDPEHTTGPHFGFLLPRVPFRIQLSSDGVSWQDEFYGFVKGGWQQTYLKPKASRCTLELEDLLEVLESEDLPGSAWEAQMMANHPVAFWRFDETTGNAMLDSSGNGRHGFIDNGNLGEEPLILGDGAAYQAPHLGDNRGRWQGEGLPTTVPCTLLAWVKTPRDLTSVKTIMAAQRDSSLSGTVWLQIASSALGSPNGELVIDFFGLGSFYKARGSRRVDDDVPHMVVCTIDTLTPGGVQLYVDGLVETKTTISGTNPGSWPSRFIWTVGNTIDTTSGDWGLDGIVDEAAVFNLTLSAEQVADLYAAGGTGFSGDRSGERIDRVLDIVGIPDALRDIAIGDTTVGPADYGRTSAASYLQGVVESEQGVLYVEHNDGGKLTFRGRYDRLTASRSTTVQASFTGSHFAEGIAPAPNGVETIVNVAEVSWPGGTVPVVDEDSKRQYGAQRRSVTTEAPTAAVAQSAGGWLVARYRNPQVRLRRVPFNLTGKEDLWPSILARRVSDRVSVTRHPQKVGAAVTNELILEGADFALSEDRSWTVEYRLSNADDTQVWIWGTSAWGTDTYWG